uniref:Uncharacterized protein n=1 Tax=Ditylenchus dipsaci TaxID=166011 RepID=A0A915E3X7_9BILA
MQEYHQICSATEHKPSYEYFHQDDSALTIASETDFPLSPCMSPEAVAVQSSSLTLIKTTSPSHYNSQYCSNPKTIPPQSNQPTGFAELWSLVKTSVDS